MYKIWVPYGALSLKNIYATDKTNVWWYSIFCSTWDMAKRPVETIVNKHLVLKRRFEINYSISKVCMHNTIQTDRTLKNMEKKPPTGCIAAWICIGNCRHCSVVVTPGDFLLSTLCSFFTERKDCGCSPIVTVTH